MQKFTTCQHCGAPVELPHSDPVNESAGGKYPARIMASGEEHGNRKLTWDDVMDIRARRARKESMTRLALHYGVSRMTISRIVKHITWREEHMPMDMLYNSRHNAHLSAPTAPGYTPAPSSVEPFTQPRTTPTLKLEDIL